MVDIMPCADDCLLRHRVQRTVAVHAAQCTVAEIGRGRLNRVHGALREVQRHGPVIRHGIDNMRQPCVDRRLRRPDMRRKERDILRQIAVDAGHELGGFLIGGVVAQAAEAFAVERLPHKLVEKP